MSVIYYYKIIHMYTKTQPGLLETKFPNDPSFQPLLVSWLVCRLACLPVIISSNAGKLQFRDHIEPHLFEIKLGHVLNIFSVDKSSLV